MRPVQQLVGYLVSDLRGHTGGNRQKIQPTVGKLSHPDASDPKRWLGNGVADGLFARVIDDVWIDAVVNGLRRRRHK